MSKYSAQAGITIRRLRNGDTLYLTLEIGDKPLFQAVDPQTGDVKPDWTVAANQPIITPNVNSTRQATVNLSNHSWMHNGAMLNFNGATSGGYTTDSTGKFACNLTTGALKIIANLASPSQMANDTLQYSVDATVSGVLYHLSKSIDVQIQAAGASSYFGFINASTMQLDSDHTSATLTANLWLSTSPVSTFYVKWYKGSTPWTAMNGQKTVTVNRDDIDASQLIICEFYQSSGDVAYVAKAAISLIDTLDEIAVVPYISSNQKEVDTNHPVTVTARIIKVSDGSVLTPNNPTYKCEKYDGTTWTKLGESNTSSINVTTADTDQNDGTSHEVVVIITVSFDSLTSNN